MAPNMIGRSCAIILSGQNEQSTQENRNTSVAGIPDIYGGPVYGALRNVKHEYHEGPKAWESFETAARTVFQAPKVAVPKKQPKAKPRRRKTTGSDKG
jgi:hypothetical protein